MEHHPGYPAYPHRTRGSSLSKGEFRDAICLHYGGHYRTHRNYAIVRGKALELDHEMTCHGRLPPQRNQIWRHNCSPKCARMWPQNLTFNHLQVKDSAYMRPQQTWRWCKARTCTCKKLLDRLTEHFLRHKVTPPKRLKQQMWKALCSLQNSRNRLWDVCSLHWWCQPPEAWVEKHRLSSKDSQIIMLAHKREMQYRTGALLSACASHSKALGAYKRISA